MTEHRERDQKYYMLLLSLFVHVGILVVLMRLTHADRYLLEKLPLIQEHTIEEQKQLPIPKNQLAELRSGPSNFGAPIIFHEEPEVQEASGDIQGNNMVEQMGDTFDQDQPNIQQSIDQASQSIHDQQLVEDERVEIQAQQEPEKASLQKEEPTSDSPKNKTSMLMGALKKLHDEGAEKPLPNEKPEEKSAQEPETQEKAVAQETPQKPAQPRPKAQQPKKQIKKVAGKKRPGDSTRTAAPVKKQLTLADLAEGFIDTLNRGGHGYLDRDGDPNTKPDFSDLKYMSYIRKVVWHMQNEWHISNDKPNIQLAHDCILSLVITFAKDGSLQNIQIIQETGYPHLDAFLIKGIRRASPYPPLPHHFNSDTFDLPLNIHNSAGAPQPWHMNLSSRSTGIR